MNFKFTISNLQFQIFSLLFLLFTFYFLPSAHASHGNFNIGATYCDPSTRTIWINSGPNNAHSNTGRACGTEEVFGQVTPPSPIAAIGYGAGGIRTFLTTIIRVIYIVSGVIFLFMFIMAAWQMITSGGDKEAVGNARKRITYAIIGLVILALSFVLVRVFGNILGFSFF